VAQARDHHPLIVSARAKVEAARSDAELARATWYPTLGALAELIGSTTNNSTATFISNSVLDLPRIGATAVDDGGRWRLHPTTLVALGIRQQIYDFGRGASLATTNDALLEAERARAEARELDVELGAAQAYLGVLAAKGLLDTASQATDSARVRRDFVVAGIEKGLRPAIDRTRAEADLSRFEVARLRGEASVHAARAYLALAIGSTAPEVDATAPADIALPQSSLPSDAAANDPILREALKRADAQAGLTASIEAGLHPNLFVTGSLSGRAGGDDPTNGVAARGDGWIPNIPNWSVGLVFTYPLFDATVLKRAEASRAREIALRGDAEVVRSRLSLAAAQALRDVELAEASVPALDQALTAARANYAQAEARFAAGLGTSTELADAEALRIDAEIQRVLGVYAVQRARVVLARVMSKGASS
jgi:outer membrane protein TolC